MTLILSNAEIASLVSMRECIDVIEDAFVELAEGRAGLRHRSDICTPSGHERGEIYALKSMDGVIPKLGVGAIRLNSEIRTYPVINGFQRLVKLPGPDGRYTGLVLLFSTATGEPLAIFPDGEIQPMRVAATTAIGARILARQDAKVVAVLGSGWQARSQVRAIAEVRPLAEIRCFSTRREMRESFAAEMSSRVGIDIEPVSSVEDAVRGADIVLAATSSFQPVIKPSHIEPGMHISAITTGEFGEDIMNRADVKAAVLDEDEPFMVMASGIALPDGAQGTAKRNAHARPPVTLLDLLLEERNGVGANRHSVGRTAPHQVTCFMNLLGLGLQFAAVGALIYQRAKEAGCGRALPTDWFTQLEVP